MNFTQFSFSNAYVYSPKTWMHKIQISYKVFTIFGFLCLVPYCHISHILIIILPFSIIILKSKLLKAYYYNCFIILFFTCICLLPYFFDQMYHCTHQIVTISIPSNLYKFLIRQMHLTQYISVNSYNCFYLIIPEFILKIVAVSIFYSVLLKTLLLTTMFEKIILSICMYIHRNTQNYHIKQVILISSFASQFLEQMIKRINMLNISVKLRNLDVIINNNNYQIYYYIVAKFLNSVKSDIDKVSSVLYSREFNNQLFSISHL